MIMIKTVNKQYINPKKDNMSDMKYRCDIKHMSDIKFTLELGSFKHMSDIEWLLTKQLYQQMLLDQLMPANILPRLFSTIIFSISPFKYIPL